MKNINKFLKNHKIFIIVFSLIALFGLVVGIPSLAKFRHRNTLYTVSSWDGTVATSYKEGDGTEDNPFIISTGAEFAFFIEQMEEEQYYENTYFELSNDIVINEGVFTYDETEKLKYTLNDISYYVKEFTNEYYDNELLEGNAVGKINKTLPIKNFKGNLDGNSFTIFGLYVFDSNEEDMALFKNLEGTIKNIYIANSISYGIGDVAGIAVNTSKAVLSNVSYNGYVVNKSNTKVSENSLAPISVSSNLVETTTKLELPTVNINDGIKSIKILGDWTAADETVSSIKIVANGVENFFDLTSSSFEVDLGTNLLDEISIVTISTIEANTINFSNFNYKIEYYDDITSGIIGNASNTSITNVINKSHVYGNYVSAGIVGTVTGSLNIIQSYNNGNINSKYISSGIVGTIVNNDNHTTIKNVYNTGVINSSIVSSAGILGFSQNNTGLVNMDGVINISDNYAINTIDNSIVNVTNSYSANGLSVYNNPMANYFEKKELTMLYTKEILSSIGFDEFINLADAEQNISNVWIYEPNSLPILYIDDLNNPVANINITKFSWSNLSSEFDIIDISNNITVSIEGVSAINPIVEKYYYISNSRVALTEKDLETVSWVKYDNIVKIEESGYYVIYAKVKDTNGKVTYLNTDIMRLNVSGFKANIALNDIEWTNFKSNLSEVYLNSDMTITLFAHDDLLTITNLEYFISDKELTEEELKNVTEWTTYVSPITINEIGKYVIYAKIVDNESTTRYINTDYLLYNGYKETINIGNKDLSYETNYITNKSSIKVNFESDFELEFKEGYTHNFISNILLPKGTILTLIDKGTNKIYKLQITTEEDLYGYNDSCAGITGCSKYATYKFGLFKELGINETKYYDESQNYFKQISNEKYIVTIDFSNTVLVDNYYDLTFHLALKNEKGKYLYQTLNSTINNINMYSIVNDNEVTTMHKLISDYNNQIIYYNSNSETNINFTNSNTYSMVNEKYIIDTTFENKNAGIIIQLYNQENEVINNQFLNNILFEIDGREYFADSNNLIKINLGNATDSSFKSLKIKTKENSSGLVNGTYYIKINSFISDDGYYYDSLQSDEIIIPLVVEDQIEPMLNYNFDVQMNAESIMLDKDLENHLTSFNIAYNGDLVSPIIKLSLYEKTNLTAYNQDYTLIDLSEYTSDTLVSLSNKQYSISVENPIFNLNLIPNKLNNNGYKYVFELYDGTKKISEIQKYFIVR